MEYVFVGDRPYRKSGPNEFLQAAIRITGNSLISLIDAFRSESFGLDHICRIASDLKDYKEGLARHGIKANLFVDSGGYSIIKGDIHPHEIYTAIDCYVHFIKNYLQIPDYIFSLDIPLSIKYNEINTKDFIAKANRSSLEKTLAVLDQSPELYSKFYFVWHFKLADQFLIWDALFRDFKISTKVHNYAIGGLVGIRKVVPAINAAPFTPIAFRCFLDHLHGSNSDKPLRLHFLGINLSQDRFQIALLEKLFSSLAQGRFEVACTYDSIGYMHDSIFKSSDKSFYQFSESCLAKFDHKAISPQLLNSILPGVNLQNIYRHELSNSAKDVRKSSCTTLTPVKVFSELEIDRYLQHILSDDIIEAFELEHKYKFDSIAKESINRALELTPKGAFSTKCLQEISNNMDFAYNLHRLLMTKSPYKSINRAIEEHIKALNFPAKLL